MDPELLEKLGTFQFAIDYPESVAYLRAGTLVPWFGMTVLAAAHLRNFRNASILVSPE
jgi:hypothetical protein